MPLRVRLTLWYGIALAVILIGLAVVLYAVMAQGLKDQVDQQLETAARAAARAIEQHPLGPFLQFEDLSSQFPELAVLDRFFQIFSPNGKITIQSPNLKAHDIPLNRIALQGAFEGKTVFQSARFPGEPAYRLVSVPIIYNGTLFNIVQVGTSLAPLQESLDRLLLTLLITVPAALILSLAGGWFLAGRALKPVEAITLAARRIASGDLTQRLTVTRTGDEIGRLAATFNDMIARLDASFRQIRQFSSDASHELRTPLTVLKGETELALRRPRAAEDYRMVLESSLEEIDRMSRIVDELLFLSRADLGEVSLESSDVALQPLIEDIHRQATVLGQDQGIHVSLGPVEPAVVRGDELRLRELLLN
ncbi:MAG: HAMP domain-containing protein, partial [Nitrospirales bacterium]